MSKDFDIRYDRRVSPEFLAHFEKRGVAQSLVTYTLKALYPLDLCFRSNPKTGAEHATLYTGLTAVLNVHRVRDGLRLKAHATHAARKNGWRDEWTEAAPIDTWRERWLDVELYLERVIPLATKSHGLTEGAVQAAISSYGKGSRVMLDREVVPHFRDTAFKTSVMEACNSQLRKALSSRDFGAGKMPTRFGAECDLLAVDRDGRLLAVEVKPVNVGSIAWVAAQATMYALVLQEWIDRDGEKPREVIAGMLEQRAEIGLPGRINDVPSELKVTPVVALQRGAGKTHLDRMRAVAEAVAGEVSDVPPAEVFEVSITGEMKSLR